MDKKSQVRAIVISFVLVIGIITVGMISFLSSGELEPIYGKNYEEINIFGDEYLINVNVSNIFIDGEYKPFNQIYSIERDGRFIKIIAEDFDVTLDWGIIQKNGVWRDSSWILTNYPSVAGHLKPSMARSVLTWDFELDVSTLPPVVKENVRGFYFQFVSKNGNIDWSDVSLTTEQGEDYTYKIIHIKDTLLSFEKEVEKGIDIIINKTHIIYENITNAVVDGYFNSDPEITYKQESKNINNWSYYFIKDIDNFNTYKVEEGFIETLDGSVILNKWNEEIVFNISTPQGTNRRYEDLKTKIDVGTSTFEWYMKSSEDFEFEIVLNEQPSSNSITLPLNLQNLNCQYQPALNVEYNNFTDCNETDCWFGDFPHRPENVVGSYACYHKTKSNNKYKTGKAFHIYRPEIIDSITNQTTWCTLNLTDGFNITCPQDFIDNANYPGTYIDPQFGYISKGGSSAAPTSARCNIYDNYTALAGDTVTRWAFYGSGPDASLAIYDVNSSPFPENKISINVSVPTDDPDGWYYNLSVTQVLSDGVKYCMAFEQIAYAVYDTDGGGSGSANSHGLTDPWTQTATSTARYSVYTNLGPPCSGGSCIFDDSYILADLQLVEGAKIQTNTGLQIMWNISELCDLNPPSIDSANLQLYVNTNEDSQDNNTRTFFVDDTSWTEASLAAIIQGQSTSNQTDVDMTSTTASTYTNISVLKMVQQACYNGYDNVSIRLYDPDNLLAQVDAVADGELKLGTLAVLQPIIVFENREEEQTPLRPQLYVTYVSDAEAPVVSLVSPANNTLETSNNNVTFVYNVTDISAIQNCSLILNGTVNQVNTTITKDYSQEFNISFMDDGQYNWSVNCTDELSYEGASSIFNLTINLTLADSESPQFTNPASNELWISTNESVNFTITITDDVNLSYCWFEINQTGSFVNSSLTSITGTSMSCSNYTRITASTGTDVYWRFWANDTTGNLNSTILQNFIVTDICVEDYGNLNGICVFDDSFDLQDIDIREDGVGSISDDGFQIMWDISELCEESRFKVFTDAKLELHLIHADSLLDNDAKIYYINDSWTESDNAGTIESLVKYRDTIISSNFFSSTTNDTRVNLSIGELFEGNICDVDNITIRIEDRDNLVNIVESVYDLNNYTFGRHLVDSVQGFYLGSREDLNESRRPKLYLSYNITDPVNITMDPINDTYREDVGDINVNCNVTSTYDIQEITINITKYYGGWFVDKNEIYNSTTFTYAGSTDYAVNISQIFNLSTNGFYRAECFVKDSNNATVSNTTRIRQGKGQVAVVPHIHTEQNKDSINHAVLQQDLDLTDFSCTSGIVYDAFQSSFRTSVTDSYGNPIVLSWSLRMDELACESPQGCAGVINQFLYNNTCNWSEEYLAAGDNLAWHFHLMDYYDAGDGNQWNQLVTFDGTIYRDESDIRLAEKATAIFSIDSKEYMISSVSGWLWENIDYSNWAENVTPFTFNNWYNKSSVGTIDPIENIFDWSDAPYEMYNPSPTNYQVPGNLERIIIPCSTGGLNDDVEQWERINHSFDLANQGTDIILCHYSHSYVDIVGDAEDLEGCLKAGGTCTYGDDMETLYPNVNFTYQNDLDAMREVLELTDFIAPNITLWVEGDWAYTNSTETMHKAPLFNIQNDTSYYMEIGIINGTNQWKVDISNHNVKKIRVSGIDESYNQAHSELSITAVTITYPISSNFINVVYPQNITVNFTAQNEGNFLTSGVTATNITIGATLCPNTTALSYFGGNVWTQNCSIPDLSGNQSITININHVDAGNLTDTNTNAIVYDSCAYSGSGNWFVNCPDNCIITSPVTIVDGILILAGSGTFQLESSISGMYYILKDKNCRLIKRNTIRTWW